MSADKNGVREVARHWKQSDYYDRAEKQDWLDPFWNEASPFLEMYRKLDVSNVVELACGHGRHTAHIIGDPSLPQPGQIVLMDVNNENVRHCRERFAGRPNIRTLRNTGMDFRPLHDGSVSTVFCFDAMVHFEYDCVIAYIRDTFRVLQKNGRALFHHSNYTDPGSFWLTNPHCRNFMSRELFAHVALRTGFEIVDQRILNWGDGQARVDGIDCLSLIEKPSTPKVIFNRPSLAHRVRNKINRWRS